MEIHYYTIKFCSSNPSIANYKRKNILSQLRINIERIIPQIDTHTLFLVFKKKKKEPQRANSDDPCNR